MSAPHRELASNPLDTKTPSYFELVEMYSELWQEMLRRAQQAMEQRGRAEKAEGEGIKLRGALEHMRWCRSCADGSWEYCDEGRAALELLGQAEVQPT